MALLPPSMIAAGIAGGGIGTATGFLVRGENLENQGATTGQQFGGSLIGGLSGGLIGGGVGLGVSGTTMALKKVLKK
jgi:hypothetical protein